MTARDVRDDGRAAVKVILTEIFKASRHGSDLQFLVELRGFEPLTPSMRTERAGLQNRCLMTFQHVRAFG